MFRSLRSRIPDIVYAAWREYGDPRRITGIVEVSAQVSTNQVFRIELEDRSTLIAKISSYGSYYLFREDHDRIDLLHRLLAGGPYENFLAGSLHKDGHLFIYHDEYVWAIFYHDIPKKQFLPRILTEEQIRGLAREMAAFHNACDSVADQMPLTSKSIKSDIIHLLELVRDRHFSRRFPFGRNRRRLLEYHCHEFLENLTRMRYGYWRKIPVLIDWNLGNFSVEFPRWDEFNEEDRDASRLPGFRFYSRWDYDWFRIEPPGLDFYFCSRVASKVGDRTVFSYLADPLLEPRFRIFLREYHRVRALTLDDLLFLKESYRFFILNYVILEGDHFFRKSYCDRLRKESVDVYLPGLEELDFGDLREVIE